MHILRNKTFHRRTILSGLGLAAAAIAVPGLRTSTLFAQDGSGLDKYKRLIVMYSSCGTIANQFWPTGGETGHSFGRILEPLAPHQDRLMTLKNVYMRSTNAPGPGGGHEKGMGHLLTGRALLATKVASDKSGGTGGYASGISVDQEIANTICQDTKFKSIDFHIGEWRQARYGLNVRSRMSYTGSGQPISVMENPYEAFKRLFADMVGGGTPTDDAALQKALRERRSLLDATAKDLETLSSRLPAEDRPRIDQHLQSIREIELRLNVGGSGTPTVLGCEAPPETPQKFQGKYRERDNYQEIGRLYLDMMTMALTCDLSRVGTMVWGGGATSLTSFPWLADETNSMGESHHGYSHRFAEAGPRESLIRINRWHAEQFKHILDRLDAVPEGDGTMLSNTVVLWGNSLDYGGHSRNAIPWVLAGGESDRGGPGLRQGRNVVYPKPPNTRVVQNPHNNLLVSVANCCGLTNMNTFGEAKFCTGPLSGLV